MVKEHQLTGMAGEFLVAGKLFKMGLQVSVTLGNAKAIDLFAHNPETGKNFNIQVKTLRKANCFDLDANKIEEEYIYVFVILDGNDPVENERYFLVDGNNLKKKKNIFFGASLKSSRTTVNIGPLKEYENKWEKFFKKGIENEF